MRSTLGTVLGVLRAAERDPAAAMPALCRVAATLGWTFGEIAHEVAARRVPEQWRADHLPACVR